MLQNQSTERVVMVLTDINGNVLDYDIAEQPIVPIRTKKHVKSSPPKQSEPIPTSTPLKKVTQNPNPETEQPQRRRVRYTPQKSTFKIFQEKVDWFAEPKIKSRNDEAIRKIRRAPKTKIFGQKLSWCAESKINTHNEEAVEEIRQRPKSQIFVRKIYWNAETKIDSHNEEAVEHIHRTPKPRIRDEKLNWEANTKIDTHNEEAIEYLRKTPRSAIYDEKPTWSSTPRTNHYNPEFVQYLQRERAIRQQTSFMRTQSSSPQHKIKADGPRIDDYNSEYIEHKKTTKLNKLPPIETRKLEWRKESRISRRNDDYIERLRQKRSIPVIFREKVNWSAQTPRIKAHNPEYLENIKDQKRPTITDEFPRWKSQAKITTYNNDYNPNDEYRPKPVIVNEKTQWYGRPKIDSGLDPIVNVKEHAAFGLAT
ncbi:unnamed protein product [Rotaria socialis]